ncbi:mCG1037847, partial [Mus musculus]
KGGNVRGIVNPTWEIKVVSYCHRTVDQSIFLRLPCTNMLYEVAAEVRHSVWLLVFYQHCL